MDEDEILLRTINSAWVDCLIAGENPIVVRVDCSADELSSGIPFGFEVHRDNVGYHVG